MREITAEGIFAESKIERIEQSMEDVFVYLVKSHAGDDLGDGRISGIGKYHCESGPRGEKRGDKMNWERMHALIVKELSTAYARPHHAGDSGR